VAPAEWVAAIIGIAGVVAGVAGALTEGWRKPLVASAAVLVVLAVAIGYRAGVATTGPDTPSVTNPPETTQRADPPGTTERADREQLRLQYAQRVGPICAKWRSQVNSVPTPPTLAAATPADFIRVYGILARINATGAAEMRTVPVPGGDEPTVARMINAFERIGFYYKDMADSSQAGSSESVMEAAAHAEKYIALYNRLAEEYGLEARCMV
jgi:hypothetical protein